MEQGQKREPEEEDCSGNQEQEAGMKSRGKEGAESRSRTRNMGMECFLSCGLLLAQTSHCDMA